MKHHFGDLLNREDNYWTIIPNAHRWQYHYKDIAQAPQNCSILTITKNDLNWEILHSFNQLKELTLDHPSHEQVAALSRLTQLKTLRISHYRAKSIDFLSNMKNLKEVVFEYVSGFENLSPFSDLPELKSLHLENLRRVSEFSGLKNCETLEYLAIYGTLDWKQPILNLDFLTGLKKLEYLDFGFIKFLSDFPIFKPLVHASKLHTIKLGMSATSLENFAYLEARFPRIRGAKREPFRIYKGVTRSVKPTDHTWSLPIAKFRLLPNTSVSHEGKRLITKPNVAYLLGKGTRGVYGSIEKIEQKCFEHKKKYDDLVDKYRA